LKQIVLRYAGDTRLDRIARMTSAIGRVWDFTMFTRDAAGLHSQTIPRITGLLEQVFDDSTPTASMVRVQPAPPDPLLARLLDSTQWAAASDQEWTAAIESSLRVENPLLTSVDDVDCAACHVTGRARARALGARPIDVTALPTRFDPGPLTSGDQSAGVPKAVMAFGYLNRQATVTDRVLNDSIVSARQLDVVAFEACP